MGGAYAVFLVALAVAAGALFWWMPQLTRRDVFFAVTVPAAFRATGAGREILARFRREMALHTLIAAAGVLAVVRWGPPAAAPLLLLWLMLGSLHALLLARHRAQPYAVVPPSRREASLEARDPLPGGWPLQAGPFVLIAIEGLLLLRNWARVPQSFPVHWDWQGRPNRWVARTPGFFIFHLALSAGMCAVLAWLAWMVARRSRVIHLHGAAGSSERQFRRIVMGLMLAVEYLVAVAFASLLLLPLTGASGRLLALAMEGFGLAITLVAVLYLIRLGQGGSRLAYASAPGGAPIGDRTPDQYWKLGIFYFNPNDPALLVEKRFGLGYTFNFGHPAGWIFLGAGLVVCIFGAAHAWRPHT